MIARERASMLAACEALEGCSCRVLDLKGLADEGLGRRRVGVCERPRPDEDGSKFEMQHISGRRIVRTSRENEMPSMASWSNDSLSFSRNDSQTAAELEPSRKPRTLKRRRSCYGCARHQIASKPTQGFAK